ncbi:MAG: ABC transporter substrate-binding protein [Chloroflexota bacterium]|nr:ABC transporter substrate-binding protein [Chloroflexota bacterium]
MFLKKKFAGVLAAVLILLPVLAACGPEAAPTPTTIAPTATSAPAVAPTDTTAPARATNTTAPEETPTEAGAVASPTGGAADITATEDMYAVGDCSYGGIMKSIEAVDDTTVKFTLCASDPAFPSKIAFSSLGIQSAAHLEETGGAPLDNPLGSGPYMVSEWVRGDHLTLVPNPHYAGDAPAFKTLIFRWNESATARLSSLRAAEADGIDNPDPNDFETIAGDTNLKLFPRVALNVFYVGMNNTKPPLDNEKVRQAIAMALNRQAIVDKFYPPGSAVAQYFTPCAIPGGCEGEAWYEYNLEQAKTMLTEAGFPNGFPIRLAYRNVVRGYLPSPDKVAEEIQAQLAPLGITATIDQQESATFLDNASAGNLEMFLLGWGADYPDATNFLDSHFGTGANNSFGNKWPDITSKLAEAASLSDQDERNALYAEANTAIKQHVPMIPIAHGGSATVYRADVAGAHSSPLGNESFAVMSQPGDDTFVWIQNGEPPSLYCADETDGEALRACEQIFQPLLGYKVGSTEVELGVASAYESNDDLTEWTVTLNPDAKFSDGTQVTAQDVVATYAVQWDAAHPLHKGRSGTFDYWTYLFTAFLNPPPPSE